ncbi:MAG: alpha/beta hydrolase [Desulfobacteraceae bacterium]|nr:alpha/beta hydrolase [Desulfobacteraceae bacterium]
MAWFEKGNVRIYYEDVGEGEPIITNHGLSEDCGYWSETGVTARLAERYRVISMDMRGHGRTVVEGEPHGYDADIMADDFDALADFLNLDRFHILTHATGGMVGVRYAMTRSERLISLMLTDTGSATMPEMPDQQEITDEERAARADRMLNATVEEKMEAIRAEPGPFLFKMAEHPDNEGMWKIFEGFLRRQNPQAVLTFMMNFYTDPDPRVEGLGQIKCPTLVLLGEHDIVFLKPSEIMAKEIPDARHVIMEGVGHMTAIEDPERTIKELLDFLETVAETGKTNR